MQYSNVFTRVRNQISSFSNCQTTFSIPPIFGYPKFRNNYPKVYIKSVLAVVGITVLLCLPIRPVYIPELSGKTPVQVTSFLSSDSGRLQAGIRQNLPRFLFLVERFPVYLPGAAMTWQVSICSGLNLNRSIGLRSLTVQLLKTVYKQLAMLPSSKTWPLPR